MTARWLQGVINHATFPMVDSTDFASRESAMSAATKMWIYGKRQGDSALYFVISGTGSLAAAGRDLQHVGPSAAGVYTIPIGTAQMSDASAAMYDEFIFLASATGAAWQTLIFSGVRASLSDILSAAVQTNSRVLLVQSRLSDLDSRLSSDLSDILSGIVALSGLVSDVDSALTSRFSDLLSLVTTTGVQLNASTMSDMRSAIAGVAATLSASDISDIASAVQIILSDTLSNIYSAAQQANSRVLLTQSMASVAAAAASNANSLLVVGVPATITASDMSDIVSRVWAAKYTAHSVVSSFGSLFSDVYSRLVLTQTGAVAGASRTLLIQSTVSNIFELASDIDSALTSRFSDLLSLVTTTGVQLNPSTLSDLRSAIAGVTATLSVSDISDIASRVQAVLASDLSDILSAAVQTNSRALVIQSLISDVDSALTSRFSDLLSLVTVTGVQLNASMLSDVRSAIAAGPAATVTASDISDIASAVRAILVSDLSDILSAAQQGNSRALVIQSRVSDVESALDSQFVYLSNAISDLHSDLQSRIGAITAAVSASDISDIASAVWAHTVGTRVDSRVLLNLSRLSDVYSLLSDTNSDLRSLMTTTGILLDASTMSDLRSAITAGGGAVTVSNISDIASAVWADAIGARVDSRILLNLSRMSDMYSLLSDANSDLRSLMTTTGVQLNASSLSDLRSAIAAITATIDASAVSDIASAVWAHAVGTRVDSRVLLTRSDLSDLLSRTAASMSDVSDLLSRTTQINSRVLLTESMASDAASAAQQANSRVLVAQSTLSDIESQLDATTATLSDFYSDFGSRVPGRVLVRADTMAEITQATPPATPTAEQALMLMYAGIRGKTKTTSTHRQWYNDAGVMITRKPIAASGGSYLESEMIAGV